MHAAPCRASALRAGGSQPALKLHTHGRSFLSTSGARGCPETSPLEEGRKQVHRNSFKERAKLGLHALTSTPHLSGPAVTATYSSFSASACAATEPLPWACSCLKPSTRCTCASMACVQSLSYVQREGPGGMRLPWWQGMLLMPSVHALKCWQAQTAQQQPHGLKPPSRQASHRLCWFCAMRATGGQRAAAGGKCRAHAPAARYLDGQRALSEGVQAHSAPQSDPLCDSELPASRCWAGWHKKALALPF